MPHGQPEYQEPQQARGSPSSGALLLTPGTEGWAGRQATPSSALLLTVHVTQGNYSNVLSLASSAVDSTQALSKGFGNVTCQRPRTPRKPCAAPDKWDVAFVCDNGSETAAWDSHNTRPRETTGPNIW